ncbi:MAG TPA: acetyl-CoA carboxylase carboxyltransferase subunit alpha, partial [Terriglobales bacterium]|nr:acetyl-CoA carboxylase carboxyltransferase subunit alpha [Terriglobales bacterium]
MAPPKVAPEAPVSKEADPASGALQASEYLVSLAGPVVERSVNGKEGNTEAAARAERELGRIERQIEQLQAAAGDNQEARRQLENLHAQVQALRQQMDTRLNAWHKAEVARHPQRPYTLDYVERIFTDWSEIHGDRGFADDPAIVCGMARFHGEEVMVVGHQKGRDTKQKLYRNFGMPHPEGYRKALRFMRLAEKFGRPIFTLVDTPGAYPGLGAEERGQAEAIARNLREMARIQVPIITAITGEGGSGGALAIAVGNRVLMMENAIYSVISPEGCASIMWRDASKRELAAKAMRITAEDLKQLGCIDDIVPEPAGGAHTEHARAAELLDAALQRHFAELKGQTASELVASR